MKQKIRIVSEIEIDTDTSGIRMTELVRESILSSLLLKILWLEKEYPDKSASRRIKYLNAIADSIQSSELTKITKIE